MLQQEGTFIRETVGVPLGKNWEGLIRRFELMLADITEVLGKARVCCELDAVRKQRQFGEWVDL